MGAYYSAALIEEEWMGYGRTEPMRRCTSFISLCAEMGRITFAGVIWLTLGLSIAHAQQFQNPPMIVTAIDPVGLVTADWNEDGHQDLAYVETGQSPTLQILLGDGKGGFKQGAQVQLPAGTCTFELQTCRMIVGDFSKNGHAGILMPILFESGWGVVFLPGNGDGTFGAPIVSNLTPSATNAGSSPFLPSITAAADFNGDGNLDIAVPSFIDGTFNICLGDGTGRFTQGAVLNDDFEPYAIFTADVNHDGKADLIVLNISGIAGAAIWLGDGQGGFTYTQTYPTSNNPANPLVVRTVADVNGDGDVDLIGMDYTGDVLVATGNADGTFNAPQTLDSGFEVVSPLETDVYAADLTGSGIPALMVNSQEGFDTVVAKSALTYGAVQKRTSGPFQTQLAFADFNEDGAPDMAVGVAGGIQLFLGNKQGAFPDSTITPVTPAVTYLFSGDFNGDGVADVAAIGSDDYMRTYLGEKGGGFQEPVKTSTAVTTAFDYIGNTVGDFDGDGHQDILLTGQVLYGNGDGTFTPVPLTTGSNGLVADLTRNGRSDLLSISLTQLNASFSPFYGLIAQLGNANRTLTQVNTNFPVYTVGEGITTPALLGVGDLNGDGYPDAVVYDPNLPAMEIWLGNGDGSFHAGTNASLATSPWTPLGAGGQNAQIGVGAIADVDGDGNADLVFLASEAAAISDLPGATVLVIEYGNGAGGFSAPQVLSLSHPFSTVALASLDASGHPGFILGNGALISVIHNLGGRQFSNEDFYSAGTMEGLLTADFTGDGLSDILALRASPNASASYGALGFTVLLNQPEIGADGLGIPNGSLTTSSPAVSTNQAFTLTAILHPSVVGSPVPTGTLAFSALGISLGSTTLSGGTASIQVPAATTQTLPVGDVRITASYSGDSFYASSDLATIIDILNPNYSTQTALTATAGGSSASSIQAGSFVTLTAVVSAPQPVKYGYVAFYDGTTILGQTQIIQLSPGQASFSTNLLGIGVHSLSAQYLGFSPPTAEQGLDFFRPSISPPVPVTVTGATTTATLTASASSVTANTVLTLTVNVSSTQGTPIGGVTFLDGTTPLGTMTLDSNGSAVFSTVTLNAGINSLSAEYAANGIYAGSASTAVSVTVNAASTSLQPTTTQLISVTPASGAGGALATVQVTGAQSSGSVTLLVDGSIAGTVGLPASGEMTFPLNVSGVGAHSLYASYGGSALTAPSASPQFQTTSYGAGADFTFQPATNEAGGSVSGNQSEVKLTVAPIAGWNGNVTLSCVSGVPRGYSCVFSPAMVAGAGTATVRLKRTSGLPAAAVMLAPIFWLLLRRRRAFLMVAFVGVAALLCVSSCGIGDSGKPETTSVVTIEATSGSIVHSVQIAWRTNLAE
jgi:hypothetical protein